MSISQCSLTTNRDDLRVSVARLSNDSSVELILDELYKSGAVVVSKVLKLNDLNLLRDELNPLFEQVGFCKGFFFGERTKRIHSLVAKSNQYQSIVLNPIALEVANHILGPNCDKIQLNLSQGIQIWPGEQEQLPHRDDSMFPVKFKPYEFMINFMWAYTDFTKENGATMIVPGSHKWNDPDRRAQSYEMTQAEMDAGDVLIYLGSVIHGGGGNVSKMPRTGLVSSYSLGWLRQYENQYLCVPPGIAKDFAPELQDLLGYTIHRPNLGMYEGNEPKMAFEGHEASHIQTQDCLTPKQNEIVREYIHKKKDTSINNNHLGRVV